MRNKPVDKLKQGIHHLPTPTLMSQHPPQRPNPLTLIACMIYDSLLLLAILFAATFVFLMLFGNATAPPLRYFLQIYLWSIAAVYFIWCWLHGGQTLAMRTWHLQLTNQAGKPVSTRQAIWRYLLASLSLGFFGAGFFWALFDRQGLFLHDSLTGCRLTKN
jgi:uncharacterized RDD family membrane protein YckC